MEIKVSTRHGSIAEATQAKIYEKVEKVQRIFERLTAIHVTVDLEKADHPKIDILATAEHSHEFIASFDSDDMFGALDQCIHKIEQQIRKYKEKIQARH